MQKEILDFNLKSNRRQFLEKLGFGLGGVALGSLMVPDLFKKEEDALATRFRRNQKEPLEVKKSA